VPGNMTLVPLLPESPELTSRKYLAVHARQLALEPGFQILRRHPQSLLLRLEQAHRYALENYVHRNKRMGLSVVISETWCYSKPKPPIISQGDSSDLHTAAATGHGSSKRVRRGLVKARVGIVTFGLAELDLNVAQCGEHTRVQVV
jgi:hypothetical protein